MIFDFSHPPRNHFRFGRFSTQVEDVFQDLQGWAVQEVVVLLPSTNFGSTRELEVIELQLRLYPNKLRARHVVELLMPEIVRKYVENSRSRVNELVRIVCSGKGRPHAGSTVPT